MNLGAGILRLVERGSERQSYQSHLSTDTNSWNCYQPNTYENWGIREIRNNFNIASKVAVLYVSKQANTKELTVRKSLSNSELLLN